MDGVEEEGDECGVGVGCLGWRRGLRKKRTRAMPTKPPSEMLETYLDSELKEP